MNIYVASALLTLVGLAGIALIIDFVVRGRSLPIGDRIAAQFGARTPEPWRWRTLNPLRYLSPKAVRAARYSTTNTRASSPHIAMREKKIAAMLAAAGLETSVAEHKQHRLVASIVAAGAAGTIFIALSTRQNIQPVAAAIAVIASAIAGTWLVDARVNRKIKQRRQTAIEQWPEYIELVALAVAAGDGMRSAIARVGQQFPGVLGERIRDMLIQMRTNGNVGEALIEFADELASPTIQRCASTVSVAAERGTPLAAVLRDQAADARESARRDLMEAAGKRELGMLLPVVFGVLPLSVVFAVFPGLSLLTMSV